MSENDSTVEAETQSGAQRPLDFSTFLLSLGTSALVQLGEAPDPTTGLPHQTDLAGARQTIDLLGLLESKTRGNLTESEDNLLRNLLRDLRVHYVAKSESA